MAERTSILVTAAEKKILSSVRELHEGPLKRRLETFLLDLTDFVRDPRCAQVQADGIPCGDVRADCEQCRKVDDLIAHLQRTLGAQDVNA